MTRVIDNSSSGWSGALRMLRCTHGEVSTGGIGGTCASCSCLNSTPHAQQLQQPTSSSTCPTCPSFTERAPNHNSRRQGTIHQFPRLALKVCIHQELTRHGVPQRSGVKWALTVQNAAAELFVASNGQTTKNFDARNRGRKPKVCERGKRSNSSQDSWLKLRL